MLPRKVSTSFIMALIQKMDAIIDNNCAIDCMEWSKWNDELYERLGEKEYTKFIDTLDTV